MITSKNDNLLITIRSKNILEHDHLWTTRFEEDARLRFHGQINERPATPQRQVAVEAHVRYRPVVVFRLVLHCDRGLLKVVRIASHLIGYAHDTLTRFRPDVVDRR